MQVCEDIFFCLFIIQLNDMYCDIFLGGAKKYLAQDCDKARGKMLMISTRVNEGRIGISFVTDVDRFVV